MTIGMTWVAEDDQDDWGDHNIFICYYDEDVILYYDWVD